VLANQTLTASSNDFGGETASIFNPIKLVSNSNNSASYFEIDLKEGFNVNQSILFKDLFGERVVNINFVVCNSALKATTPTYTYTFV